MFYTADQICFYHYAHYGLFYNNTELKLILRTIICPALLFENFSVSKTSLPCTKLVFIDEMLTTKPLLHHLSLEFSQFWATFQIKHQLGSRLYHPTPTTLMLLGWKAHSCSWNSNVVESMKPEEWSVIQKAPNPNPKITLTLRQLCDWLMSRTKWMLTWPTCKIANIV